MILLELSIAKMRNVIFRKSWFVRSAGGVGARPAGFRRHAGDGPSSAGCNLANQCRALAARGKPSTKLPRGRLLSRFIAMLMSAVSRMSRLRMSFSNWTALTTKCQEMNTHEHNLHPKEQISKSKSKFLKTHYQELSSRAKWSSSKDNISMEKNQI